MTYEKFNRAEFGRSYGQGGGFVSVRRNGLGINKACSRKHFKDCENIELYYDESKKSIGIKLLLSETSCSYKIKKHSRSGSFGIYAKEFLLYYKINHEKVKRYVPVWNEEEGLLEIQLAGK